MAVILRCSFPSSRPNAGHIFRRSQPFPAKSSVKIQEHAKPDVRDSQDINFSNILKHGFCTQSLSKAAETQALSFDGGKVAVALRKLSMLSQTVIQQILFISPSIDCKPDDFQMTDRQQACGISQKTAAFDHVIAKAFFAHQRMGSFSFPTAFVLANTVMLGLPSEVLAEVCEADTFSVFNMPLLFAIALIGAAVGGLVARQRKGELKRLNDQLRQINAALRRQAKIESYAPNLSYAPVGRIPEKEIIVDPKKQELISNLKSGKNFLRNQEPEKAFVEFNAALQLAQSLGDPIEEKKAARGLGASLQRLGKYKEAIKYHSMVLSISEREGETSGNTEAYGAIADCYTELGDLERAGKFYDQYISRLETD